jgi:hypothetical protein
VRADLELDHFGAQLHHQVGGGGTGQVLGDIQHAVAVEYVFGCHLGNPRFES